MMGPPRDLSDLPGTMHPAGMVRVAVLSIRHRCPVRSLWGWSGRDLEVMVEKMRLMTVHAHPDDESSKGAATMVKYVTEGHEVMVVTCTGGERGDILNPAMERPDVLENMNEFRRKE